MRLCPNCNTPTDDNAVVCPNCGLQFAAAPQGQQNPNPNPNPNFNPNPNVNQGYNVPPQPMQPMYDPYDHTAEFDPKDISDNKVMAMLGYLFGFFGIIIALIASKESPYTAFHVRQALKFSVVNILMLICTAFLFWTIIVPIAYGIMSTVFLVIRVICFFQVCSGKAKEPAIIRSLKFLK